MTLSRMRVPNTFIILCSIILLAAVLTWIIPGGHYERETVNGREQVVAESFTYQDNNPQSVGDILIAPIRGIVHASEIIGFVLIVGGIFGILQKSGAVEASLRYTISLHHKSKLIRILLIPIFMTLFSLGGSTFGMSEETIPFVLIFVPLALALGYDSIVGVAIPYIGAGVGFAGAMLNPFTVGIAHGIAGLPMFSGSGYRFIVWSASTVTGILFVMIYAARIKKNPSLSPAFAIDQKKREDLTLDTGEQAAFTVRHKLSLLTFALGMIALVIGVKMWGWYIEEIAALFIAIGLIVAVVSGMGADQSTDAFISGAKDLVATALMIGLARAILIIAQQGNIIDTMLFALSSSIDNFHPIISAQLMFLVQTVINFFVPSGSGQAALTMPIMAPLADLVGVTRQTAVLAYQMGDGFGNLIIPTSGVTMGVLTLAKIPWEKWAKWILPLELIFLVLGFILLIPPILTGWS